MVTKKKDTNKIQTLSGAAVARAERKAGVAITALEDPNALGKIDLLLALAYEIHKRENTPEQPYEVFAEGHSLQQIMELLGINDA